VGVAALAAGGAFAALTKSKDDAADKLCHADGSDNTCTDDTEKHKYDETVSAAKRYRTFAYVGFGVGAAALVTGTVLFFTASGGGEKAALSVSPVVGPGVGGVIASGRF
jgi:hypothetical protein